MRKGIKEGNEKLQYAVYGGLCGILGILSVILLLISVLECRPAILNAIGRSIVSASLAIMAIHLGKKSDSKEGKSVIFLGLVILILVIISYIFGIMPCATG